MSAKQLRRLQERDAGGPGAPAADAAESDDAAEAIAAPAPRRSAFASLADSSGEESEAEAAAAAPEAPRRPAVAPKAKSKKAKKKQKKKLQGAAAPDDVASEPEDDDALLDGLVAANRRGAAEAAEAEADRQGGGDAWAFVLSKASFSAEKERSQLGGRAGIAQEERGGADRRQLAARPRGQLSEGHFAHHRRLFLVEPSPEERWRRPDCNAEVAATDGTDARGAPLFRVVTTREHARSCRELAALQMLHDIGEVQEFLLDRPFSVEALLILADVCRGAGEHQQAFALIRRAVYSVECGFGAGLSPLSLAGEPAWPCARLELPTAEEPSWPGWSWLWAMWEYMMALASQGLHRTAVEVGKLQLAMTLPRDPLHVLAHLDFFCLRAGLHEALLGLSDGLRMPDLDPGTKESVRELGCSFPNFAYSAALAARHHFAADANLEALQLVEVAHVLGPLAPAPSAAAYSQEEGPGAAGPHARLMRAMLLFPQVLRPLLEALGVNLDAPAPSSSSSRSTWNDLLERPPFVRSGKAPRHARHFLPLALVADAFARRCAPLWRDSALQQWLHACAARLVRVAESTLFDGELRTAQDTWSAAPLSADAALATDYRDFSTSEVDQDRAAPSAVRRLLETGFGQATAAEAMAQQAAAARMAPPGGGAPLGAGDEEAELQAAIQASQQAEEARQRRQLVEDQDRELQESLEADRAKEAGAAGAVDEAALSQLVEMGFPEASAREALAAAQGDVGAAVVALTG